MEKPKIKTKRLGRRVTYTGKYWWVVVTSRGCRFRCEFEFDGDDVFHEAMVEYVTLAKIVKSSEAGKRWTGNQKRSRSRTEGKAEPSASLPDLDDSPLRSNTEVFSSRRR